MFPTNGRMINVGVDVWDFTPVTEETVIELASVAMRVANT